jgi:glycosyltransferase involved in cell wall biosynthesis
VPAHVIPNAANTDLFMPSAQTQIDAPRRYALFFGALSAWQGIDTLIEAVRQPSWPQEIKLVIAGDGAEREKLKSVTGDLIVYLGTVPYRSMPGLIAHALAGLIPKTDIAGHSATGLSPLKLYETLACGTPVIVSDFPGMADLVRESGAGLAVEPCNPAALAEAVAYLYRNPEVREKMGTLGRTAVVGKHSWDCRAEATYDVLCKAARAGGYGAL